MPESNSHHSGADQKESNWISMGNFIVSVLTLLVLAATLVAVICYTHAAQQQVMAMNRSVGESQKLVIETDKLVAAQTEATHAAEQAAEAASSNANTARDAFVVNVSADLMPQFICDPSSEMQVRVGAINNGNSIAKDVWLGWWFVDNGQDTCRGGPKSKNGTYEGGTYNRVATRLEKGQESNFMGLAPAESCISEQTSAMKQAAVTDIQRGSRTFGIVGHIDYTDVAGGQHSTPFNYTYDVANPPARQDVWTCKFSVPQPGNSNYADQ
jgi:cell division protein FtsL